MNRFCLVALALASAASGVPVERDQKSLSLFNVVTFPNDECTSTSTTSTKGTCLSTTECSDRGGKVDGNCAAGFGVCCTFFVSSSSGGTVSQNCTYVTNNGYPTSITTASASIAYTVNYVNQDICSLRLDFTNFVLPITAATGICIGTLTANGPSSRDPPALCGTNTGEHIYVETGRSTTATTLTIATGTGTTSRSWKIKISQIECSNVMKPPADCAQYFTGASGVFQSPNFANALFHAGLEYAVCIRQEKGYCQNTYYTDASITSPDQFTLTTGTTPTNTAAAEVDDCTMGRLQIPLASSAGGGHFCGAFFANANDAVVSSNAIQTGPPFFVYVTSPSTTINSSVGFRMQWKQIGC